MVESGRRKAWRAPVARRDAVAWREAWRRSMLLPPLLLGATTKASAPPTRQAAAVSAAREREVVVRPRRRWLLLGLGLHAAPLLSSGCWLAADGDAAGEQLGDMDLLGGFAWGWGVGKGWGGWRRAVDCGLARRRGSSCLKGSGGCANPSQCNAPLPSALH